MIVKGTFLVPDLYFLIFPGGKCVYGMFLSFHNSVVDQERVASGPDNRSSKRSEFFMKTETLISNIVKNIKFSQLYEEEDEGAKVHLETKLEVLKEELEKCGEEQEEVDKKEK